MKGDGLGKALHGQRFVLTGTWPQLGGGQGLTLSKDAVKGIIEKHGEIVTAGFSQLTNALVIGESLGPKKVLDTHGRNLAIITLSHLNDIFHVGVSGLSTFRAAANPVAAMAILKRNNIQVQRLP